MLVAGLEIGEYRGGGHIQGGRESGGAVADVVVSDTHDVAQTQRQQRLGPIEGLDLRFFVNAEHNCLIGRVELDLHDVSYLLDKEGIVGELE